jgi:tRNA(adenine34) deaminase
MFTHEYWMKRAIEQAMKALADGEVPVGAVIIRGNAVIGKAHNQVERLKDPTAHAEMLAITQACESLGDWRLEDCVLYVTKEPCPMCAGAIRNARLRAVCFGLRDETEGACGTRFDLLRDEKAGYFADIAAGVLEPEAQEIFQEFFRKIRNKK